MLQNAGLFHILTYKCASRHSGVPFFEHLNFQNGSGPVSFLRFWLENVLRATAACHFSGTSRTCKMAPALRCFVHFDLQNVLGATAACHFSTSELQKWLRECGVLHILTFKCAFRHSRVPFFTCPPNSYLRTRRFSEPTFRTSGTTIHWENTAIRDFTNIFRACWTACEWLYTHVDLLASDLTDVDLLASDLTDVDLLASDMTAVRLCFSTLHIVGS